MFGKKTRGKPNLDVKKHKPKIQRKESIKGLEKWMQGKEQNENWKEKWAQEVVSKNEEGN